MNEYQKDVFEYIEPNFLNAKSSSTSNNRFLIFSAPGATGKTTLAKHICYKYNGIYWNLPETKVAEHSCEGTIGTAVEFENLSNFIISLEKGDNFFVIDGFDEAEVGSGRTGVEFFIRDLNNIIKTSTGICAIL